ncbi:NTF2-like domain containing protein [Trema orientale]|uniref:NTF2-like domain containing protein n=1 Tax=Trema orientale TaxID=63057 RepID=A0A2P5EFS9_TREOI|nr:NTF2-like domain containing protein [Trema orientale]
MTILSLHFRTLAVASASSYFVHLLKVSSSTPFSFQHHIPDCLVLGKVSESIMGKEADIDQMREVCSKEACEFVSRKRLSDNIIPHILNLYASKATPKDFQIYAPDASFEDPLMCAHGVKQIKSAFYSLSKVFAESKIVEYSIKESLTSPGKGEILIDNKQYYKFLGRNIDVVSLIKLHVVEGKVVRHEDWWDKKPLWNRETVKLPLVGRLIEITRRGSMLATHAMMGFGKDPTM